MYNTACDLFTCVSDRSKVYSGGIVQTVQKQRRFILVYPKRQLAKSEIRQINFRNRRKW